MRPRLLLLALTGASFCLGAGCATRSSPSAQSELVDVSLDAFTGRNSFRPIQRQNTVQGLANRKR